MIILTPSFENGMYSISQAAKEMVEIANTNTDVVFYNFNNVILIALPNSTEEEIVKMYQSGYSRIVFPKTELTAYSDIIFDQFNRNFPRIEDEINI